MEELKKIIKDNIRDADCGIFFSRNLVGDPMTPVYIGGKYTVYICYPYNYFEIFGLSKGQQEELEDFYKKTLKDL